MKVLREISRKTFCVFLKKTLAKFFSCGKRRLVLRERFTHDVRRLLGMNKG